MILIFDNEEDGYKDGMCALVEQISSDPQQSDLSVHTGMQVKDLPETPHTVTQVLGVASCRGR